MGRLHQSSQAVAGRLLHGLLGENENCVGAALAHSLGQDDIALAKEQLLNAGATCAVGVVLGRIGRFVRLALPLQCGQRAGTAIVRGQMHGGIGHPNGPQQHIENAHKSRFQNICARVKEISWAVRRGSAQRAARRHGLCDRLDVTRGRMGGRLKGMTKKDEWRDVPIVGGGGEAGKASVSASMAAAMVRACLQEGVLSVCASNNNPASAGSTAVQGKATKNQVR